MFWLSATRSDITLNRSCMGYPSPGYGRGFYRVSACSSNVYRLSPSTLLHCEPGDGRLVLNQCSRSVWCLLFVHCHCHVPQQDAGSVLAGNRSAHNGTCKFSCPPQPLFSFLTLNHRSLVDLLQETAFFTTVHYSFLPAKSHFKFFFYIQQVQCI